MTSLETLPAPRRGAKAAPLLLTPTATDLGRLFRLCQEEGEFGIVIGEPGVGKSSAIQCYANENPGTYVVSMSPAHAALVPFLEAVANAVGASVYGSGAAALTKAIRSALRYAGLPSLLLIDEAQHLSAQSLEEGRAIFDDVRPLGLVLVGSRAMREQWAGRQWAQLHSRIFQSMSLEAPAPGDVDAICAAVGVTDRKSLTILRRAAKQPGGLRVVRKVLAVASRLAQGEPITSDHVEVALQDRLEWVQ